MRRCAWLVLLAACSRPGEDRALAERTVGQAEAAGVTFEVGGGLACVRAIDAGTITLWAQAPVLTIDVTAAAAATWTLTVDNLLPDAALTGAAAVEQASPRPTRHVWTVDLPAGATTLTIAPPDIDDDAPWRFAALADIQTALPEVDEVFDVIDADPTIRFVISMGDLTQRGEPEEYDLLDAQLATLDVPFYATLGNHELFGDSDEWTRRFGRSDVHFAFRGVTFSLLDSGNATIDPEVHAVLDGWLAEAADRVHVIATHYPPIDPVGARAAGFASPREAAALLARLAAARVDLTLYGHVHTYEPFSNAGIPAYISGGGGAEPMRFDGIDRHFLVIDADPAIPAILSVAAVRVDAPYSW